MTVQKSEGDLLTGGIPGHLFPGTFFENQILNVVEAARFLKCSRKTVYRLVSTGELPHKRIGSGIRFLFPELIEWMKKGV